MNVMTAGCGAGTGTDTGMNETHVYQEDDEQSTALKSSSSSNFSSVNNSQDESMDSNRMRRDNGNISSDSYYIGLRRIVQ